MFFSLTFQYHIAQTTIGIKAADISFTFTSQDVSGTFEGFKSASFIDLDNFENSKFEGSINVKSIDTGSAFRDLQLQRTKYFDAENYPVISFESKTIKSTSNTIIVTGLLTIKGTTDEISFAFTKNVNQLIGKTTLYSSDYGVQIKPDCEKNKVIITIVLHLNQ